MKILSALDLRKKLGSVLNAVAEKREPVTITRANKPLAVIVSADEYEEKMLKSKRGQKLKEISSRLESWRNEHRKETAHVDAVKAIREVRTRG
jgi:prevent-host-death family protein